MYKNFSLHSVLTHTKTKSVVCTHISDKHESRQAIMVCCVCIMASKVELFIHIDEAGDFFALLCCPFISEHILACAFFSLNCVVIGQIDFAGRRSEQLA